MSAQVACKVSDVPPGTALRVELDTASGQKLLSLSCATTTAHCTPFLTSAPTVPSHYRMVKLKGASLNAGSTGRSLTCEPGCPANCPHHAQSLSTP